MSKHLWILKPENIIRFVFSKKEYKFILGENDITGEIKYWQNAEYMGIDQII